MIKLLNISKEWIFIFLLTFIGLFLFVKAGDWWVDLLFDKNIKLLIIKNNGDITDLDMLKNKDFDEVIYVNTINFPESEVLSHKQLGLLGYTQDFFMALDSRFIIEETGLFNFNITSDDGFRLQIDNNIICQHNSNRPMKLTPCQTQLKTGEHHLHIDYYQGFGGLGLVATYKSQQENKPHFIGENSKVVKFISW